MNNTLLEGRVASLNGEATKVGDGGIDLNKIIAYETLDDETHDRMNKLVHKYNKQAHSLVVAIALENGGHLSEDEMTNEISVKRTLYEMELNQLIRVDREIQHMENAIHLQERYIHEKILRERLMLSSSLSDYDVKGSIHVYLRHFLMRFYLPEFVNKHEKHIYTLIALDFDAFNAFMSEGLKDQFHTRLIGNQIRGRTTNSGGCEYNQSRGITLKGCDWYIPKQIPTLDYYDNRRDRFSDGDLVNYKGSFMASGEDAKSYVEYIRDKKYER